MLDQNRGVGHERVNYNFMDGRVNPELVFQQEWDKRNRNIPGLNDSIGTAQRLMIVPEPMADSFKGPQRDDMERYFNINQKEICIYNLTLREQKIIATIIQWLGTNVGFSFLTECLDKCGYHIVRKEKEIPLKEKNLNRYEILRKNYAAQTH
jgi:hypothetical protein